MANPQDDLHPRINYQWASPAAACRKTRGYSMRRGGCGKGKDTPDPSGPASRASVRQACTEPLGSPGYDKAYSVRGARLTRVDRAGPRSRIRVPMCVCVCVCVARCLGCSPCQLGSQPGKWVASVVRLTTTTTRGIFDNLGWLGRFP